MSVQMCTCDTAVRLRDRISDLEVRLADALARNERLEVEAAATTLRADELERELANERELRNVLEEAVEDSSIVATLKRIIARHAAEMQDERARHATEMQEERARLDAATIRHEQATLDLVSRHRQEVSQRLDRVLDQNKAIFARISASLQDLWAARRTTRPSLDKEHWFILAQEEEDEEDGNTIVTFKIHSGQRSYIDRIGRDKDVLLASPAANGVDIRQSAKKRMRDLTANHEGVEVSALRFSCADANKSQGFLALLLESIDIALISPTSDAIERIKQEATDNLREAFDSAALFANAVLVA